MRDPFTHLPSGCEDVSFDIDIVPLPLPICSLPDFTEPTLLQPSFPMFSVPFVPSPWNCASWPTVMTSISAPPLVGLDRLILSIKIGMDTVDACDYSIFMSYIASLPCLPLDTVEDAEIAMVGSDVGGCNGGFSPPDPNITLNITMLTGCIMDVDLGISIPCIAFNPDISLNVSALPPGEPPSGDATICVAGCNLEIEINLGIPGSSCVSHQFVGSIWFVNGGLWKRMDSIDADCNYAQGADELVFQGVECP